jgi:hypothetical protein
LVDRIESISSLSCYLEVLCKYVVVRLNILYGTRYHSRHIVGHQEIVLDHYRNTTIDELTSGKLEPIATSSPKNRDNSRSTVYYNITNSNTTSQSETTTKTDNLTILTINFQSITNKGTELHVYNIISSKVLNLFDISIRSSVSKNVVEKFGRPH